MKKLLLALGVLFLTGTSAFAQFAQLASTGKISVTTSSTAFALGTAPTGTNPSTAFTCNLGANPAYVRFGTDNTITVSTANGTVVPPGGCEPLYAAGKTYVAALGDGGATTLVVMTGSGTAAVGAGSSTGGATGGPVTQGTSPWITQGAPLTGTGIYSGATVGTTDGTVSAGAHTNYLELINASNSATICINLGATATISGTQCAAGEISLPPLGFHSWGVAEGVVPQDAIHAIANAAGTQLTVGVK